MARITASADFIFQKIAQGKPDGLNLVGSNAKQARDWFRARATEVTRVDAVRFMRRADKARNISAIRANNIGQMMMFWYDAKLKKELPYWDKLPLIFPIEIYHNGFLGINLHYLPLPIRARLMDALYTTMNNKRLDETTRLRLRYRILANAQKFRYFKPCIKRYLNNHVRSPFMVLQPDEWDMALCLPTERFQKKRKEKVWVDSVRSVNGDD